MLLIVMNGTLILHTLFNDDSEHNYW